MNTQFAFLKKDNIPSCESLKQCINKLGYDLSIDPEFNFFKADGFSPCILNGDDGVGFEIYSEPSIDVTKEDNELSAIAGDNDYCISMSWGGDFGDMTCVMIVSLVLHKYFGAVVTYEGEEAESEESLKSGIEEGFKEIAD